MASRPTWPRSGGNRGPRPGGWTPRFRDRSAPLSKQSPPAAWPPPARKKDDPVLPFAGGGRLEDVLLHPPRDHQGGGWGQLHSPGRRDAGPGGGIGVGEVRDVPLAGAEIGRASCRERV